MLDLSELNEISHGEYTAALECHCHSFCTGVIASPPKLTCMILSHMKKAWCVCVCVCVCVCLRAHVRVPVVMCRHNSRPSSLLHMSCSACQGHMHHRALKRNSENMPCNIVEMTWWPLVMRLDQKTGRVRACAIDDALSPWLALLASATMGTPDTHTSLLEGIQFLPVLPHTMLTVQVCARSSIAHNQCIGFRHKEFSSRYCLSYRSCFRSCITINRKSARHKPRVHAPKSIRIWWVVASGRSWCFAL